MGEPKETDFEFKTKPLKHQLDALCKSATKQNFAYLMEMGCVDGETEFLSNRGWIKFKDFDLSKWEEPLLVGQCIPSRIAGEEYRNIFSFAPPTNFIKKKVPFMYQFYGVVRGSSKPCLDIRVTPDHNMRCKLLMKNRIEADFSDDVTAEELHVHIKHRVPSAPVFDLQRGEILQRTYMSEGVLGYEPKPSRLSQLNEWELRVQVAIMADGNFPRKDSDKVVMEFMRKDKIERFEYLCSRAGIPTVKETCRNGAATRFHLIAPVHKKIYDEEFWLLSPIQQGTIFREVFKWDGSELATRWRFYTIHKQSADFIQFLGTIHGYRATLETTINHGAPYYTVSLNPTQQLQEDYEAGTTVHKTAVIEGEQYAYCFRVPAGQLLLRRNDKIFITGNSGKTKVMIDNMTYLKKRKVIEAAIILAPKGVYRNWSTQEIPKHMPDDVNPQVLVWKADASAGYKRKLLDDIRNYDPDTFPIFVFNIESLLSEKGMEAMTLFMKVHKGMLMGLIDESTCIKNHKAKRTKKALEIGSKCRVKRIATGSPITNSPLDLYSQFAFLDKQILGCGSYYAFRNVFANIERITTRQGQSFDKIIGYKNLPMLSQRIKDFSYRITKKECLDLPDKIYITRDVELTPEQKTLYKNMKDLSFATMGDEVMSVQVALTKMLRLHQILCGSFTTDEGVVQRVPNKRLEALEETLDETSGKVIIWANYIQNIRDIEELLTNKYGAESFVTYIGATGNDDRVEAIKLFQNANSPVRFFVGNVQTAGRGITLTAANTVIYFSNNYSLEMRQQSEDRAHRVGQKNAVTYIDLVAPGTLDEKIIQALLAKRNIANEVLHDNLDDWITL